MALIPPRKCILMNSLFLPLLVDSFAFRLMYRKSILIHFPVSTAIIVVYLLFNPICTFSGYCVFDFGSRGNLISCPARCPHYLFHLDWYGMVLVWYGNYLSVSPIHTHIHTYTHLLFNTPTHTRFIKPLTHTDKPHLPLSSFVGIVLILLLLWLLFAIAVYLFCLELLIGSTRKCPPIP